MSQQERAPSRAGDGPLVSPWALFGAGLGLVALGWIWGLAADDFAPATRALTLAVGLTVTGFGLKTYLSHAKRDVEGKLTSAGLWLLCAAALYLTRVGLGSHFDSMHVLLAPLMAVAVLGAILTALPPRWRMLVGGGLILLHFAAILTAVTVVPPPEGPSPYWSSHLWTRASRPWLQLTMMNNGYHFYAPEPGPAQLVWFYVEFDDGESTWVRIPDHNKVQTQVERRRLGALATAIAQPIPPSGDVDRLHQRRVEAGMKHQPPIPMANFLVAEQFNEYHEPSPYALVLISSYVRRVARTTEHPKGAEAAVKGIKVYRVDYYNPPVQHFQAGRPPLDPTLYAAYFMGEYDAKGNVKASSLELKRDAPDGPVKERIQDPFLYWQLPIVSVPPEERKEAEVGPGQRRGDPGVWRSEGRIINYVRIHAGDKKDQETIP